MSVYIKILINYSQTMGLLQKLDLKWPDYVSNIYQSISKFGFISTDILSMDCFIGGIMLDLKGIYIRAVATFFFYILFMFLAVSFFFFGKFFLHRQNQFNRFILVFLVFSSMIQPTFIQQDSDIFTCKKVDDMNYIVNQMSVECYTNNHNKWVLLNKLIYLIHVYLSKMLYFGFPILVFWIIIYPISCLIYLMNHKKDLDTVDFRIKMGYYLNGYRKEYFYWYFVLKSNS